MAMSQRPAEADTPVGDIPDFTIRKVGKSASSRGYTFIELIVVSAVLAILASAIVPMTRVTMQRQREVELRRNLREVRTAIDKFKDAVDLGIIPQTEVSPGSENYPKDSRAVGRGARGGQRCVRADG